MQSINAEGAFLTSFVCLFVCLFVSEWKSLEESSTPDVLASANSVLVTWLGDQLAQLQDDQRLKMVAILFYFYLLFKQYLFFTI